MYRRILSTMLLSLSLPLTACAAYDEDNERYSSSRYADYGQQQSRYTNVRSDYGYRPSYPVVQYNNRYQANPPVVRYREYPAPAYRYPQRQPVVVYRQAPQRYRAAPGYREQGRHERYHDRRAHHNEHYGDQRQARDENQGRNQSRGWEVRRN